MNNAEKCRYGVNGFFGICLCERCNPTRFPTCAAVGECPRTGRRHHFYWDGDRDSKRMSKIHGKRGKGHADPESKYSAVICKHCGL